MKLKPLRRIFCWKFAFYDLLLPFLRRLGPARCDAALRGLGRLCTALQPGRRTTLIAALRQAQEGLATREALEPCWPSLAANTARFLARDYPLDLRSDDAFAARFDVRGHERLFHTLECGLGAILVGSHLGAHIAGLHWMFRGGLPVRALVQRPRHVSRTLDRLFDEAGGPYPQAELFLHRDLSPTAAVERMLRARAALRDGLAIYLNGDIPWHGPNTREGMLLGRPRRFLSIWTELAVLTSAPVFQVFCTHLPGGRFALEFKAVGRVRPGEEDAAVTAYLKRLESRIAANPSEAVAHLLWPSYASGQDVPGTTHAKRPGLARSQWRSAVNLIN